MPRTRRLIRIAVGAATAALAAYGYGWVRAGELESVGSVASGLLLAGTVAACGAGLQRVVTRGDAGKAGGMAVRGIVVASLVATLVVEGALFVQELSLTVVTYATYPGETYCRHYEPRPPPWSDCYVWVLPGTASLGAGCDPAERARAKAGLDPVQGLRTGVCYRREPLDRPESGSWTVEVIDEP